MHLFPVAFFQKVSFLHSRLINKKTLTNNQLYLQALPEDQHIHSLLSLICFSVLLGRLSLTTGMTRLNTAGVQTQESGKLKPGCFKADLLDEADGVLTVHMCGRDM